MLTESDTLSSSVTTWTVTPEGSACQVRISTTWQGRAGSAGCSSGCSRRGCCAACTPMNSPGSTLTPGSAAAPGMTGQAGRPVYISADMEGITGLVDAQDVQPGGADYERGRVLMTEDVNAAIARHPRRVAASTAITVNDAHGPMRNILPDLLHPAARLIRGKPKPMGMLAGLDGTHGATALTNQPPYC